MKEKFVLFGAGLVGSGVIHYFDRQIVAVIDNDLEKQGNYFEGIPIISLNQYKDEYLGLTIIIAIYSKFYFDVVKQLEDNMISNYFLIPPVVYGYPTPKQYAEKVISSTKCQKVLFDSSNPISREMGRVLSKRYIDSAYLNNKDTMPTIPDDSVIVLTQNNVESNIREHINDVSGNVRIYDIYNELREHKKLVRFKGIHQNEKCFIIGNGPSLKGEDLEELQKRGITCFASNGIFHIYDKTKWRPDYYTVIDALGVKRFEEGIISDKAITKFIVSTKYLDDKEYTEVNYFAVKNYISREDLLEFSSDISKYVVSGKTVTYAMLQIAVYMGFKEIYLLGVDWTGGKCVGNLRYDFYDGTTPSIKIGQYNCIAQEEIAYKSAQDYAKNHNIKIYNATRGGELEIYDRVDFDRIMEEWK